MGVFIQGMEMPERCSRCPLRHLSALGDIYCQASGLKVLPKQKERSKDCPLIEVKAPHGNLIDVESLKRQYEQFLKPHLIKKYGEEEAIRGLHFSYQDVVFNMQGERVVIPEEKEEKT